MRTKVKGDKIHRWNVYTRIRKIADVGCTLKRTRFDSWHILGLFVIFSSTAVKIHLATLVNPFGIWHTVYAYINGAIIAGFPAEQCLRPFGADASFLHPYVASLLLRFGLGARSLLYFNLACNVVTALLVYLLTAELYDKETAILASCLVSLSWYFLFHSFVLFYEGPLVALVTGSYLSLYVGLTRDRNMILFSGTLCALMFLMKYPALITVVNFFTIFWMFPQGIRRFDILAFFTSFLSTILAWIYYEATVIGIGVATSFGRHIYYFFAGPLLDIHRILWFIYKYLLLVPYMTSAYSTIFAVLGLSSIVGHWKRENYLVLSWLVSFFSFYCLYHKGHEYYSLSWLVPSLILSAKGMRDFLKDNNNVLRKFAVGLAVFSVYVEGPIPFLKLRRQIPFVFYKQTRFAHETILQKGTGFLEPMELSFVQALNAFDFHFTFYVADAIFFLSLFVPVFILSMRKAIKEHSCGYSS